MLSHLSSKERLMYAAIGVATLVVAGLVGSAFAKKPAEIKFQDAHIQGVMSAPPQSSNAPGSDSAEKVELVVHIVGLVNRPGVYKMDTGTRVMDLIEKAGGAKPEADLDAINLAAKLVDGTQLQVPKKGNPVSTTEESYAGGNRESTGYVAKRGSSGRSSSSDKGAPTPGSVSLNSATKSQLEQLPGVGPSTAQKIIDYRMAHGGFSSIEELLSVKGIGPKKLADMRKYLRL